MQWIKVVETGRKVVESGVERALMAANSLEHAGRKAAHTYNCLAERAPFPLPRIPFGEPCAAEEVPVKPPVTTAPPVPTVVTTESLLDKASKRAAEKAPPPAAPVAPAVEAAPAKRRLPTYNTMTKKMKKAEVQDLARSLGIELTGEETTARLAELVLSHG